MSKKSYKVLSVRVSLQDIASAIELCDSHRIPTTGQSGAISKALGLLLESLRNSNQLSRYSDLDAQNLIRERYEGREAGKMQLPKLDLSRIETPNSPEVSPTHFAGHEISEPTIQTQLQETPFALESQFALELEEDIRLMKQLEDETLLSSILVTTHREDDHDAKLIDPSTVKYPILEKLEQE